MNMANRVIKELKARGWKAKKSGSFTELRKGPVFSIIGDAAVSCTVDPLRAGANIMTWGRLAQERWFIVPSNEDASKLTAEEQELRSVVLEQTKGVSQP
jgi:hypothetical protein